MLIRRKCPAVLTASEDGTAKIWSSTTGKCTQTFGSICCTQTFTVRTVRVRSASFSVDESSVLTASEDKTARIWSSTTGECTQTFTGHTRAVLSAVFSDDESSVPSGEDPVEFEVDLQLFIADLQIAMQKPSREDPVEFEGDLQFSIADFQRAIQESEFTLLKLPVSRGFRNRICGIARSAMALFCDHLPVSVVAAFTDEALFGRQDALDVAVVGAKGNLALTVSADRTANMWCSVMGMCKLTYSILRNVVCSAVLSTDGNSLLTASFDRTAKIWSTTTGKCTQTFSGHQFAVAEASFRKLVGETSFQIFVILRSASPKALFVKPSDTIAQLKAKIQLQFQVPIRFQLLLFGCQVLSNSKTCYQYGIGKFAVLQCVLRQFGGMPATMPRMMGLNAPLLENSKQPESLPDAVDRFAIDLPDMTAAVDHEYAGSLSYKELAMWSLNLAAELRERLHGNISACDLQTASVGALMRRGCAYYATYVAAARCRAPFVPLSLDHRSKDEEERRWYQIQRLLSPMLVVVDACGLLRWAEYSEPKPQTMLVDRSPNSLVARQDPVCNCTFMKPLPEDILAYVFTGGTTRSSRCVTISHEMVLHELNHYSDAVPLRHARERILQLSSAYWGAAFLGEIDVALSCGGTVVFVDANGPDAVWNAVCACQITVLGLVPALLTHLPVHEAKHTRLNVVLAWADSCPAAECERWQSQGITFIELLIATEYWLSFYARKASSNVRTLYRPVTNLNYCVLADCDGPEVGFDEVGELCIAGPMVSSSCRGTDTILRHTLHNGVNYLCTGDLVRRVAGGIEFAGRRDKMTKSGGRWVDLLALEEAVRSVEGVLEVAITSDTSLGLDIGVFVSVVNDDAHSLPVCVDSVRAALPADGVSIHFLPKGLTLPRNNVTHKVDIRRLVALVNGASDPQQCRAVQVRAAEMRCQFLRSIGTGAVGILIALLVSPALLLIVVVTPSIWLSLTLVFNECSKICPGRCRPRHRVFAMPVIMIGMWWFSSLRCLLILLAMPGLLWTLSSKRMLSWLVLFWEIWPLHAASFLSERIAYVHARCALGCFVTSSSALTGAVLDAMRCIRARCLRAPKLLAHFKNAKDLFDGHVWYSAGNSCRQGIAVRGAPRLETSGALSFGPEDAFIFLQEPLPKEFTLVAAARYRTPTMRVSVCSLSENGVIGGVALLRDGSERQIQFSVERWYFGFPVLQAADGGWSNRLWPWRIIRVDGGPVPEADAWPSFLKIGMELCLEQQTGRQQILTISRRLTGGWFGGRVGCAWWDGKWHTWSPRLSGGDFTVIALRTGSDPAVFVNGQQCDAYIDKDALKETVALSQMREDFLGVNTGAAWETWSHCALLELMIFQGQHSNSEIERLSGEMLTRTAAAGGLIVPEQAHPIVDNELRQVLEFLAPSAAPEANSSGDAVDELELKPIEYPERSHDRFWQRHQDSAWTMVIDEIDSTLQPDMQHELGDSYYEHAVSAVSGSIHSIVEHVLQRRIHPSDVLTGVDSLRLMALSAALMREKGISVGVAALTKAGKEGLTIAALEELIATAQSTTTQNEDQGCAEYTIWATDGLYEAPLHWTLEAPSCLDVSVLKSALCKLCEHHVPLRAVPEGPASLYDELLHWTSDAAAFQAASLATESEGTISVQNIVTHVSAFALWHCWPRYKVRAVGGIDELPFKQVVVTDEHRVEDTMRHLTHDFVPPVTFALVQCMSPRKDFIHIAVSHALCDGSAIAPLKNDLIKLYLQESGESSATLPAIPDALAILSHRLKQSLLPSGWHTHGAPYLGGWRSHAPKKWGYRRIMHIRKGSGMQLQYFCKMHRVPVDIAFIAALACAIARCDGIPVVRLSLTASMRDGPGEAAALGLFTDWRDIDIHVPKLKSLLSTALHTADMIRGRKWSRSPVSDVSNRVLMNMVSADSKADGGFLHRVDLGCMHPPAPYGRVLCDVDRPLEFQGWRTKSCEWTLAMRLSGARHPPSWADRFAALLREVIEELAFNPLAAVHH